MQLIKDFEKVEKQTMLNVLKGWFDEYPVDKLYIKNPHLTKIADIQHIDNICDDICDYVLGYGEELTPHFPELTEEQNVQEWQDRCDYARDVVELYTKLIVDALIEFAELSLPEMYDIDTNYGFDAYVRELFMSKLFPKYNIVDKGDISNEAYYLLHTLTSYEIVKLYHTDYSTYLVYNKPIVGSTEYINSTDNVPLRALKQWTKFKLDEYDYRILFEAGYFDFMACQDLKDWNCTYDIIAIMLTDAPKCNNATPNVGQIIGFNYGLTDCRTADDAFAYNLDTIKSALREIVERHSELNSNSTLADLFKLLTTKHSI
jgi:hypothetical protein